MDRVTTEDVAEPGASVTLDGTNETESPIADTGTVPVNDTLPANPILPMVTVVVAGLPATKFAGVTGPADMEKSGSTITVMNADRDKDPLAPDTVI